MTIGVPAEPDYYAPYDDAELVSLRASLDGRAPRKRWSPVVIKRLLATIEARDGESVKARVTELERVLRVIRGSAELRPDGTTVREIDEVLQKAQQLAKPERNYL